MNDLHVCIFGGTTEGRLIAEFLSQNGLKADLYVATDYGRQFVKDIKNVSVYQKKLDERNMTKLFINMKYDYVVDATHPFAETVTKNIINAACAAGLKYFRIIRNSDKYSNCIYFATFEDCADYLRDTKGNILLTTGSKNLEKFTGINDYNERIYVRILPMISSLKKCMDLGYLNKNIICMQGPFSEELNTAIIKSFNIKYLVTKESSAPGGLKEKVNACEKTGTQCLVIKKPYEEGLTLEELCQYFKNLGEIK